MANRLRPLFSAWCIARSALWIRRSISSPWSG